MLCPSKYLANSDEEKKSLPWFSGQISQLLLQFTKGPDEKLVHFYKSSSFSKNVILLTSKSYFVLKQSLKDSAFSCNALSPNIYESTSEFLLEAVCPSRASVVTQRLGWVCLRIKIRYQAREILVNSRTVETCKRLTLQSEIQLSAEQSRQVPNWQYHSKCQTT